MRLTNVDVMVEVCCICNFTLSCQTKLAKTVIKTGAYTALNLWSFHPSILQKDTGTPQSGNTTDLSQQVQTHSIQIAALKSQLKKQRKEIKLKEKWVLHGLIVYSVHLF